MNTHADKTQENKSQSVANNVSQKKSDSKSAFQFVDNRPEAIQMRKFQEMANNYTQKNSFQFVDNRPEAIAQRKLQEMANNSPRAMQLKAFQYMANNSPQAKQAAQLQAMANNYSAQQQQPIQKKENNTGLPDNLKTGIENLSGYSMDDVKVHYNSGKPAQLQAHAYAQGTNIHLASGQEKHLPHEAWHVVQQKQGRVKPTIQMKTGVNVNDDVGLEKEADVMGDRVFDYQSQSSISLSSKQRSNQIVVQRAFIHNSTEYNDNKQTTIFAGNLYDRLSVNTVPSINRNAFIQAVVNLATRGQHGVLNDNYFQGFIEHGVLRETFTFQPNKRRIDTIHNPQANFPPQRSFFHQRLAEEGQSADLSYNDLRGILENILKGSLSQEEIDQAVQMGIRNFDENAPQINMDTQLNPDLQLLSQHLLRYQAFNRGQLQDIPENRDENAFRKLIMEMSKEMIRRASSRLDRVVPKKADFKQGGSLQDALPGLIDLNRPLDNSVFGEETYKAVFQLMHTMLRKAYDRMKAQQQNQQRSSVEQISDMRPMLNPSLFETIEGMDGSTIPRGQGLNFLTDKLGMQYDEGNESFDEESDIDSEDPGTDDELYDEGDPLFYAHLKRKTALNSFGLFSKTTSQKEMLDENTPQNQRKFDRLRQGIDRRSERFHNRYEKRYKHISGEVAYYDEKIDLIEGKLNTINAEISLIESILSADDIRQVKDKLKSIPKHSPLYEMIQDFLAEYGKQRANTKEFKQGFILWGNKLRAEEERWRLRLRNLGISRERAQTLDHNLEEFYFNTPVGNILDDQEGNPRGWRRGHTEVFGNLGPKTMDQFVYHPFNAQQQDEARVGDRVYTPQVQGIRDGGECLWDTLRQRYHFSSQDLTVAAQIAGVTVNQHVEVNRLDALVNALNAGTNGNYRIVLDIFNMANLQHLTTRFYGNGNQDIYIGLFWLEEQLNGHFVPPKQ